MDPRRKLGTSGWDPQRRVQRGFFFFLFPQALYKEHTFRKPSAGAMDPRRHEGAQRSVLMSTADDVTHV